MSLSRRLASEAVGTALLLACVVGSGIMGERLAGGNVAIALLANTIATGAVLVALILTFGSISAHFNPAVTLVEAWRGATAWSEVPAYVAAEVVGAILGVMAAHLMFELPIVSLSQHARSGPAQMFSEFVATFGLLSVILGVSREQSTGRLFCRRSLHHGCVLVYRLDVVCESGRDAGALPLRHFRGDSPVGRVGLSARATRRSGSFGCILRRGSLRKNHATTERSDPREVIECRKCGSTTSYSSAPETRLVASSREVVLNRIGKERFRAFQCRESPQG